MPRIPTYDGQQVRSNALQPVQQREIDVSSGLQSAARALGQVADVADKRVRRDAEIEANRVDTEITAGWLQWDAENRRRFQGQNVDQYEAEAKAWWDKAKETYAAQVSPLAAQAIGQQLGRKRNQALGSVLGHVNAEKERFADQQGEAAAMSAIEFGVDTGDTAAAAMQVRRIVAERGARKGWTTEQVQADQQRLLGTLHLSAITTMAERDATAARAYYEANKGEIPAQAQARVEQVLTAEADNQFAKLEATRVHALPPAERAAELAKITDPQRLAKTRAELTNIVALEKAAQAEREAAASDEAWQLASQGRAVPETVLMQMNGRERAQLVDWRRQRAEQAASGRPVQTDWAAYIDARERLAAGERVELRTLTTKIAPAQMEQLLDIQTRVRDPGRAPEVATAEQQISTYIDRMELSGARKAEERGQFKAAAQDLFNEHAKRTGKAPTFEERQAILDRLTTEVVLKQRRFWSDQRGPAFQLPRDQLRQQVAPAAPRRVTTVQEAMALPPGTRFIDPNGVERIR